MNEQILHTDFIQDATSDVMAEHFGAFGVWGWPDLVANAADAFGNLVLAFAEDERESERRAR